MNLKDIIDEKVHKIITNAAKRAAAFLLIFASLSVSVCGLNAEAAVSWPYPGGDIQAEGAVVMDADSETVLWGRNQNTQYYPASVTKMMTALVIAEKCSLDEKVPVTANAVYGLESGATTAGLSVDDILTVEDLLNALLLKSANDAANALAIYAGGSISGFADMMNEKAKELGCKNTNFKNPSGLTDEEHVTTPYDMALIAAEFVKNDSLLEIESHDRYKLSPTQKYPSGLTVTMGHKMLRSGTAYSDDRVIAGKTGYISASGNTLVTVGEQDGRRVIVVCMKDKNPYHYTDTETLLNFGFTAFQNTVISDPAEKFSCLKRLVADKICREQGSNIIADEPLTVTFPNGADPSDITVSYDYNIPSYAPDTAAALMKAYYGDYNVGSVWILNDRESTLEIEGVQNTGAKKTAVSLTAVIAGLILTAVIIFAAYRALESKKEKERKLRFRQRQKRRLEAMGLSGEEFEHAVKKYGEKRNSGISEIPESDETDTSGNVKHQRQSENAGIHRGQSRRASRGRKRAAKNHGGFKEFKE